MAPPNDPAKPASSPNSKAKAKEREKEKRAAKAINKSQSERLKTVVRRLPPNLPEDIFWQSVQQWVTEETVAWKEYHQGKFRRRLNKENIPSRAYIAFKDEETLAVFSREYDGHLFRDKAGNESIAVVEFAPFQKVPSDKKKVDSKMGTIERDEDYISFLKSLEAGPSKLVDLDNFDSLVAASQPPPQPTTTPLLEALKAEKSAQKDKEAILRAHAHYKDAPAIMSSSSAAPAASKKAEEQKKKSQLPPTQPQPQKGADAPQSKRAAKKARQQAQAQQQAGGTKAPPKHGAPANAPAAANAPKPRQRERPPKATAPAPASASNSAPASARPTTPAQTQTSTPVPAGSAGAPADPAAPAPAPTRRTRPMLGLASRQFEAALSGAGVPLSAGERRSRREREKAAAAEGAPASSPALASPPSPVAAAQIADTQHKSRPARGAAPVILQRDAPPKILARESSAPLPAQSGGGDAGHGHGHGHEESAAGAGRGGRSRGRGRGRGGMRGG